MPAIDFKNEVKVWGWYFGTIIAATFLHEVGHCVPAWLYGYRAIPTLAKEYTQPGVPGSIAGYISLGGVLVSVLFAVAAIAFFVSSNFKFRSALLAGALATPAIYTVRFILAGRGHDSNEFQQAQAVSGFDYSGHAADWIFLGICITGALAWIVQCRPALSILGRLVLGAVISVLFIVALQTVNNLVFDPVFAQ